MTENETVVQINESNDLETLEPIGEETLEDLESQQKEKQDPNLVFIAQKNVKLWKHIERKKRELYKEAQQLLGGIQDPLKLSRHNRRAFLRANTKFEALDRQSRSLVIKDES